MYAGDELYDDDITSGVETYEDVELRMDVSDSIHEYEPDENGRCQARLIRHGQLGAVCGSTQRSSVMHADEEADHRQRHYHGGGDCMCFEFDD